MADNGRWFKVWTSILDDADFEELDLDDVGRWVVLGALMKSTGENGVLRVNGTGRTLCRVLRVDTLADAKRALARLPNVLQTETPVRWAHGHGRGPSVSRGVIVGKSTGFSGVNTWCERHGEFFVTFKNWRKYQRDSTAAERAKASRLKRRGEERRQIQDLSYTREVTTHPETPDPPGDSDLASLWEGSDRTRPGPDGIEGRNGRTSRYPVEDLVGRVASRRSIVPATRRVGV